MAKIKINKMSSKVETLIYGLHLIDGKYYVGKTNDLTRRFQEHQEGTGSVWTKLYPPISAPLILKSNAEPFDENLFFKKYVLEYGLDNVRGDIYCQVILSDEDIRHLHKEMDGIKNHCYNCHQSDHFISQCPLINHSSRDFISIPEGMNMDNTIRSNCYKLTEIKDKNNFELGQTDMCKYLKEIAGHKFLYKKTGDNNYKLYCFNGKYWQNDDIVMRQAINDELYPFLQKLVIDNFWNRFEFRQLKSKIENLKTMSFKRNLVETYKEYGVNNFLKFDNKWNLLGFSNIVYDMEEEAFREYRYDDYVSMTTGYAWREPTDDEISTVEKLIAIIMPITEERELYLQILSTAIDGRCLEKLIIFNGGGGNGKGMIDDLLLLALGNYALSGSNAILFESSKTGSNPEKANMHKKRLVIFREPAEKHRFENSVVKELTGGGTFSARSHHEKETEKELNATIIVECNKKPLFAEEPTNAETRRIIDLYFRSTFTDDISRLDVKNNVYMADSKYKTKDFQEKHKFALLKILMKEHVKYYKKNNSCLIIPKSVADRTQAYLELSSHIVQWFKDNYELSSDPSNVCKLKDVYDDFVCSPYYSNLSKLEKRKYNKGFFVDYFETNVFLKTYCKKIQSAYSIQGWQKIPKDSSKTILA